MRNHADVHVALHEASARAYAFMVQPKLCALPLKLSVSAEQLAETGLILAGAGTQAIPCSTFQGSRNSVGLRVA